VVPRVAAVSEFFLVGIWAVARRPGDRFGRLLIGLYLTKRSVEKYINGIFVKLDLPDDQDVIRSVAATLVFLSRAER
jgi:hypothetical protein